MTNASVKNLLFGVAVLMVAAALSLGAFATTVNAETWSDYDFGGDGWSDYDYGGFSDYDYGGGWSDYDYGGYSDYDYGGWTDYNYDNWSDYGYNDYELYNNDYELYNNDYELYNNDYELYNNDYELYDNDYELYDQETTEFYEQYDLMYTQQAQAMSFANSFVPPQYQSFIPQTPVYPQPPVYPKPPVVIPQQPVQPNINNCVNNSCNNTNTNVNTNVTTISAATPQPIVQYVAPSYPVYPTYYNVPNYSYNQAPYCVITITQSGYGYGMITLSWSSQYATSAYITPSVGQVAPNGSTSLYAYGNSVYTLTVTGPGGSFSCHTQSYIAPSAPVSPYVSLTQIPYTGITMSPIVSAMYWTALLALAISGAYLLVYYKGGAIALATSMIPRKENTEMTHAVAHEEAVQKFELPTEEVKTRDAMKIVRDTLGTPRLVISRS